MSLPDENLRALQYAYDFLLDLIDPKKTPSVPKAIRFRARRVLKHYPWDFDLKKIFVVYYKDYLFACKKCGSVYTKYNKQCLVCLKEKQE